MNVDEITVIEDISVISNKEITLAETNENNKKKESKFSLKDLFETLGISAFGIIGFTCFFTIPWTLIPRTDSIIYQSHWMEVLLPWATTLLLITGTQVLELRTWTKEKELMSIWNYLKIYSMHLIPYAILYFLSYIIWSVYLQFNHPLPNLFFILMPVFTIRAIEYWFLLPSNLLSKEDFRQKLKMYTFYFLWIQPSIMIREVLASLYVDPPGGFQFLIPFMVVGCREVDSRVRSIMVTKMAGEKDEDAISLLTVTITTEYSIFNAIRLVGAEWSTLCCTVGIDFILNLKMTLQIIKEHKKITNEGTKIVNAEKNFKITTLILAEMIEGFTPLTYAICILMAYEGPNSHLFSNIGNSYWGKEIEDLDSVFVTMSIVFGVHTLSVLIDSICFWKSMNINMMSKFCEVLRKYWYFIAVFLSSLMVNYNATLDVNFGVDDTQAFQWISNEGWINLVNASKALSNEEKAKFIPTQLSNEYFTFKPVSYFHINLMKLNLNRFLDTF